MSKRRASLLFLLITACPGERDVFLDVEQPLGALNRDVAGTAKGSEDPATIELLRAAGFPHIRVDASLEVIGADCAKPDFSVLDARVRAVRAARAEPLVILSYTPACLSRYTGPRFGGQPDPTKHPPADSAAFAALVRSTVEYAALTPGLDVRWFEGWNEPDAPQFFQGTIFEYLDLYETIAGAIEDVRRSSGLDLRLGGPAVFFPDPLWLTGFLERVVARGLRLDFVSWHWYANYPLVGPIFGEQPLTIPPINIENPLLDPGFYGDQVGFVRGLVADAWSRRRDGAPSPFLWLDEWNLNAGHDPRHDTTEAAGFAAIVLERMLEAGLERSSFFTTTDLEDPNFNQGMFFPDGTPKPVYALFRLWRDLEAIEIPVRVSPSGENIGTIVTRSGDGTRIAALFSNWAAVAKRRERLTVDIPVAHRDGVRARLRRLPASAATGLSAELVEEPVTCCPLHLTLEDSSVALLELELAAPIAPE